jgi:hypothetical protein
VQKVKEKGVEQRCPGFPQLTMSAQRSNVFDDHNNKNILRLFHCQASSVALQVFGLKKKEIKGLRHRALAKE